nr:hypothetical protein [Tanacetum cinerariifolium]
VKENQEKDKIKTKPDKNEKLKKIDLLKLLTTDELWLGISDHDAVRSVSAVLDVCHQVVASETHDCAGEGSGLIYAESQDKFSVLQLLYLASNEQFRPVVDFTQLEGSVGFDNMLDPGCKDKLANDNDQEGLVKLVDKMSMEEHISANIVDEKVVNEKREASPRLSATEV